MSCRITRSAMSSWSVGSLLIITSRAPKFFASIGKPAAGQTAAEAAGIGGIAVQRHHVIPGETRYLVQIVDVLGDDGGNLAGPIERCERAMAASRLCRRKSRLHRKAPSPCLLPGLGAGDEFVERDWTIAG